MMDFVCSEIKVDM